MDIGILTFQRELNDGALFQLFCLFKLLENEFPNANIEIIDYLPQKTRNRRRVWRFSKRKLISKDKLKYDLIKKYALFCHKYKLKFSKKLKVNDSLEKGMKAIKKQNYDVIFVGSDTVWDTRENGGAPKPPNVYFLPDCTGIKKIAFAASMDKGGPHLISKENWNKIIKYIDEFDYISVRDQATMDLIKEHGITKNRIHYMPDPTLIYNFTIDSSERVDKYLKNKNVAGIAVSDNKMKREATKQLIDLGYNVINLLGNSLENQISIPIDFTLEEKILVYKKINFLITDRFHGSIFKLKQNQDTPVLFIEPDYYYKNENSKGRDLFNRLGISEMVWRYLYKDEIPPKLIINFINKWKKLKPSQKINNKLLELKQIGYNNLNEIKFIIEEN